MKSGDMIKKVEGSVDVGVIGLIVDIITVPLKPKHNLYYRYVIVTTVKGVRRWYCDRCEVIIEGR